MSTVINNYNRSMGGAYLHDQKVEAYWTSIKIVAWQPRIFAQFLHNAVNSTHVLYKHYYKLEKNDSDYAFLDFVMLLVKEMCGAERGSC